MTSPGQGRSRDRKGLRAETSHLCLSFHLWPSHTVDDSLDLENTFKVTSAPDTAAGPARPALACPTHTVLLAPALAGETGLQNPKATPSSFTAFLGVRTAVPHRVCDRSPPFSVEGFISLHHRALLSRASDPGSSPGLEQTFSFQRRALSGTKA